MNAPTFYARDGEVYWRAGLWVPRGSAERLLKRFRKSPHFADQAAELSAAMEEAYHERIAA